MKLKAFFLLSLALLVSACNTVSPYSPEKCRIPDLNVVKPYPAPPTILYVHGWQILQRKKNAPIVRSQYTNAKRYLKNIFPGSEVIVLEWTSTIPWSDCLNLAGEMTDELARQLLLLPKKKRENIVLLGHSIGAGIVGGASAIVHRYGAKVGRVVLLGSAIAADSPVITDALLASKEVPIIVYCPQDGMLRLLLSWAATEPALGAFGYAGNVRDGVDYVQYCMPASYVGNEWFYNHMSANYLKFLENLMKMPPDERKKAETYPRLSGNLLPENHRINVNFPLLWKTERQDGTWLLQTFQLNPNIARVIEHGDYILACGDFNSMNNLYELCIRQRTQTEKK